MSNGNRNRGGIYTRKKQYFNNFITIPLVKAGMVERVMPALLYFKVIQIHRMTLKN